MSRHFRISSRARRDIVEIVVYISGDSPGAAERVRLAILDAIATLGEQPRMGHRRDDLTSRPLRFWSVMGRYTIVYRGDRPIEIVRIAGPGRDLTAMLG